MRYAILYARWPRLMQLSRQTGDVKAQGSESDVVVVALWGPCPPARGLKCCAVALDGGGIAPVVNPGVGSTPLPGRGAPASIALPHACEHTRGSGALVARSAANQLCPRPSAR